VAPVTAFHETVAELAVLLVVAKVESAGKLQVDVDAVVVNQPDAE